MPAPWIERLRQDFDGASVALPTTVSMKATACWVISSLGDRPVDVGDAPMPAAVRSKHVEARGERRKVVLPCAPAGLPGGCAERLEARHRSVSREGVAHRPTVSWHRRLAA